MKTFFSASFALAAVSGFAAPLQWTAASGGNGHYYDLVLSTNTNWDQAKALCDGSVFQGFQGHFATFTSLPEWTFARTNFRSAYAGPGSDGSALQGVWLGASHANNVGPGNQNWSWATGEAVTLDLFTTVDFGEGNTKYGLLGFTGNAWGDWAAQNTTPYVYGYMVEYEAVPEPATFAALGLGALAVVRRRRR